MVVMVPAERSAGHLLWHRDQLRRHMPDREVRGFLDALLRQQGQSRRARSGWLAYLLDGASNHPEPFDVMAESFTGSQPGAGPGGPPSGEWPDDPTDDDDRSGAGVRRGPPDSSGSAGAQAIPEGEMGPHDLGQR